MWYVVGGVQTEGGGREQEKRKMSESGRVVGQKQFL